MNQLPQITLLHGIHKHQRIVRIIYPFNQGIINKLKQLATARWSASMKCWYINNEFFNLKNFFTAINMKLGDIDPERMLLKIEGGKGNKDRYVQMAKSTLSLIRAYCNEDKPVYWLFEGRNGKTLSGTSVVNIVKDSAKRVGLKKKDLPPYP